MAQRKKPPRRKPPRKPSRKPRRRKAVVEASGTTITVDKKSVKKLDGLRDLFRQLEILAEDGILDYDGGDGGDYQAPCHYPHLVLRRD